MPASAVMVLHDNGRWSWRSSLGSTATGRLTAGTGARGHRIAHPAPPSA
jgi:hypothetical protein